MNLIPTGFGLRPSFMSMTVYIFKTKKIVNAKENDFRFECNLNFSSNDIIKDSIYCFLEVNHQSNEQAHRSLTHTHSGIYFLNHEAGLM